MPAPKGNEFWKARKKHGRNTKYEPRFCLIVEELGGLGKSPAQMAAHFAVGRTTLDRWVAEHEDFREAFARAMVLAQDWWERKAVDNLNDKSFQTRIWEKSMQARFRSDYTDRKEVTGANGAPIETKHQSEVVADEYIIKFLDEIAELKAGNDQSDKLVAASETKSNSSEG
ncbi:MAG: hypothetical protein ACON4C_02275 [Henriciella sp.]